MPILHLARRLALASALSLCLSLLPSPAAAQSGGDDAAEAKPKPAPKKKAKAPAKPAETAPAAKPAQAAEKAAPLERTAAAPRREEAPPPPRPARTQAPRPPADPAEALMGKFELEGALGLAIPFESGINTGFKLNASGFYGFRQVAPNMLLQLGGSVGFTYNGLPSPIDGSFIFFDFLPTARLRITVNDKLFAYADGGLGLAFARAKVTIPIINATSSTTDAAFLLKLGGGFGYDLNEKISLVGEPALNIYMKSGSTTELSLLVGALYRL